jgi:hypothetical protein
MFLSALSLMAFLGRVAYNAWPEAVIVMCLVFGIIMSLQFLVYGAHWCSRRLADGARLMAREIARVFETVVGRPGPPPPYSST